MVIGRPSIASKICSKSSCWSDEELVQRRAPAGLVVGHDHPLHLRLAVGGHEHVLGAAQPDALGAEGARAARVLGRVGVGAHAERAQLVAPLKQRVEARVDLGGDERDVVQRDGAGRAVDGDEVALVQDALADAHLAGVQVDVQGVGAGHRGAAHAAGHERRVRRLAALGGEDALGGVEAGDVVGLGEGAHEDDRAPVLGRGDRVGRGEDDGALGRAWRGGDAAGDDLVACVGIEGGVQQRVQRARLDRRDRLRLREQALADGVDREADRGLGGALGVARLQHVQAPLLDGELGVLHVAVVALQRAHDLEQLGVRRRHPVAQLGQVARRAHAGDDVLALGVDEEVAAGLGRAGDLVAREGHAGARGRALVAVDHLLHVDRGAPVVGDVVDAPVGDGALAHPGVEDRADGLLELLAGVGREVVERLEARRQLAQGVGVELGVQA